MMKIRIRKNRIPYMIMSFLVFLAGFSIALFALPDGAFVGFVLGQVIEFTREMIYESMRSREKESE